MSASPLWSNGTSPVMYSIGGDKNSGNDADSLAALDATTRELLAFLDQKTTVNTATFDFAPLPEAELSVSVNLDDNDPFNTMAPAPTAASDSSGLSGLSFDIAELLSGDDFMTSLATLNQEDRDELAKLLEGVLDNIPGAPEGDAAAASAKANTLASYMAAAEIVGDAAAGGVPPREFDFPTASFQDLTFDMFLGSGQFGQVSKGTWNGKVVAIKRMTKMDEESAEAFFKEARLMAVIDHANCVRFHCATTRRPNICIVTEYMDAGDMEAYIYAEGMYESLGDAYDPIPLIKNIACGMDYLHNHQIIHRDIKPENILLKHEGDDRLLTAKIADYGFAKVREQTLAMTQCGTPAYVAPEVVRGEPYSELADVFSFGVLFWESLVRSEPYASVEYANVFDMIRDIIENKVPPGPIPDSVSPVVQSLLASCLDHDPAARPTFADVYKKIRWL